MLIATILSLIILQVICFCSMYDEFPTSVIWKWFAAILVFLVVIYWVTTGHGFAELTTDIVGSVISMNFFLGVLGYFVFGMVYSLIEIVIESSKMAKLVKDIIIKNGLVEELKTHSDASFSKLQNVFDQRFGYHRNDLLFKPNVKSRKIQLDLNTEKFASKLAAWLPFWPFFIVARLLVDVAANIAKFISTKFKAVFNGIANFILRRKIKI